jgi:hypothetical protein
MYIDNSVYLSEHYIFTRGFMDDLLQMVQASAALTPFPHLSSRHNVLVTSGVLLPAFQHIVTRELYVYPGKSLNVVLLVRFPCEYRMRTVWLTRPYFIH